jgi:small subunit ribosomal protein S17
MAEKENTDAAAVAKEAAAQADQTSKQAKRQAKKQAKADESQTLVRATVRAKSHEARNIGLDVPAPSEGCDDEDCPFHGRLRVRGAILDGIVVSDKMIRTVIVRREYKHFVPKYERLEKRTSKHRAHSPPCLGVKSGDSVTIMECRPLSKTVSFVVVQKK